MKSEIGIAIGGEKSLLEKICITIIFIILMKITINGFRLIRLKQLENSYKKFTETPILSFHEKKYEIVELFKKAGLSDRYFTQMVPIGLGHGTARNITLFDNIGTPDPDIVLLLITYFKEAAGIFKKRIFDSLNPIYWIEFLIFLPQNIIYYLGLNKDSKNIQIFTKVLNIIWWIISVLIGVFKFLSPLIT